MSEAEFLGQLKGLENSMYKFAYRLTQKKEDVKDLVQETFLKALVHQAKFVSNENMKAWVFTIMKNTFINAYRHRLREVSYFDNMEDSIPAIRVHSSGSDHPDSTYSEKEIIRIIGQLKPGFRIPFVLFLQGYRYKEIADTLKLNIGTVKSRIFLSRKHLMTRIEK
jgi:RNA polymerase sigma-70 factor (ECF subfamily)